MFSRFIHVVPWISKSFLFYGWTTLHCGYAMFVIYPQLMEMSVFSSYWLLWIMLLRTFMYRLLCGPMYLIPLGIHLWLNSTYLFGAGFFSSTLCLCNLFDVVACPAVDYFSLLFRIPFYEHTTICLFILWLMDIWVVYSLGPWWIIPLDNMNILYMCFTGRKSCKGLLGKYTEVGLLGCSFYLSAFPDHAGVLVHVGAGHSLVFLQTCGRSCSLPGHTFRADSSAFCSF